MTTTRFVVQIVLGAAFAGAGSFKAFGYARAKRKLPWVPDVPEALVRFIGLAELLGGLGLVLPRLTGVGGPLASLAGAGLAIVMALAASFHARRRELGIIPVNVALGLLAAFVSFTR